MGRASRKKRERREGRGRQGEPPKLPRFVERLQEEEGWGPIRRNPPGAEISEGLITLIRPLLKGDEPLADVREKVSLGALAWNLGSLDLGKRITELEASLRQVPGADSIQVRELLDGLIERRLRLFPHDKRWVVSFDVTEGKDQFHIQAASAEIDERGERGRFAEPPLHSARRRRPPPALPTDRRLCPGNGPLGGGEYPHPGGPDLLSSQGADAAQAGDCGPISGARPVAAGSPAAEGGLCRGGVGRRGLRHRPALRRGLRPQRGWGFTDLFSRPGRFTKEYFTLSDCPCPADRHSFVLLRPGLEVVAAHYHRPIGTGLHNEVLSVIGLASGIAGDALNGMKGFDNGLVELRGTSVMSDAAGLAHSSTPRLLAAQQIAAEFPQMDLSNLAGGGLYLVDHWPEVQMVAADDAATSRMRGTLRINGQPREIDALSVERGNALGVQSLSGVLRIDGDPPPQFELAPWWLVVIQITGIQIDADVGVMTQAGDSARAVIRVGDNNSPIRGTIFQDVVVTSTDPWVTDVEISGQLRVADGIWALPLAKNDMDFLVQPRRARGVADLFGVERGNSLIIPVDFRVNYTASPSRELPARFVGSMTLDSYDAASGAFRGTVVRELGAP